MNQKIRVQISKQAPVKFVSHLDYAKVLERAIRRAALPIAFSEGFNPHMKISYGTVLPLGMTSDVEFVDFEFTQPVKPQELKEILNQQLPPGFRVVNTMVIPPSAPTLMAWFNLACYQLQVDFAGFTATEQLQAKIDALLAMPEIWIEKKTKSKTANTDIRTMIERIKIIDQQPPSFKLEFWLQTGNAGNLRPEQVLAAMQQYGLISSFVVLNMHRAGLYQKKGDSLREPWDSR